MFELTKELLENLRKFVGAQPEYAPAGVNIMMACSPCTGQCKMNCSGTCKQSCTNTCRGSCKGGCTRSCKGHSR